MSKRAKATAKESGEYKYSLTVDGCQVFTDDANSVSVIFGNLDGRNFSHIAAWRNTHEQYCRLMGLEWKCDLSLERIIEVVSPDGQTIYKSRIGAGVQPELCTA